MALRATKVNEAQWGRLQPAEGFSPTGERSSPAEPECSSTERLTASPRIAGRAFAAGKKRGKKN